MPQNMNFPFRHEASGSAAYVELEPGDMTTYRFVLFPSAYSHNWDEGECPVMAVAAVDGVLFPGIWISVPRAREWWRETREQSGDESLSHAEVCWVVQEASRRLRGGLVVNPWTARAALLAVLIKDGEIQPGGKDGD
jgi:hypothetical protein